MGLVFSYLVVAIATAIIANSRGRSSFGWLLLGLLFSLIALIVVAVLPAIVEEKPPLADPTGNGEGGKTCPRCAETIKAEAVVCRFCGAEFSVKQKVTANQIERGWKREKEHERRSNRITFYIVAFLFGSWFIYSLIQQ